MDLPAEAECCHCGEKMVLVENLYYVHAGTGKPQCPKATSSSKESDNVD